MARVELCRALEEAVRNAAGISRVKLNDSQRKALDILVGVIKGSKSAPLGAIQGPPGTGKTSIVEAFARDVLPGLLDDIESRELVVYVAPTNYLAVDAFKRIAAALLASGGFTLRDILDMTRVYGHKVALGNCAALRGKGVTGDMVRRVIHGEVRPGAVRLVFATEFQRVSGRFAEEPGRVHLIVDEASKSPYFRAFIPMADAVMRFKDYPSSLVALGDPEQAIAVPKELRRIPLLMEKIMGLLRDNGLERENYELLRVTYRLPKPSEEPISRGFYRSRLQAYYTASRRLGEIRHAFEDARDKVLGLLDELGATDSETKRIHDAIYNAVTSDVPLVVLDTGREFRPTSKSISTYDEERARVAVKAALVLQAYSMLGGSGRPAFETLVTAPYSDMASNVSFAFSVKYTSRLPRLRPPASLTVHSLIGGESDAVVAVLGKEYTPSTGAQSSWAQSDPLLTIYFNEPQVLNVQLSRHKRLLVIVGNVEKLAAARRHQQGRKLSETARGILDLAASGHALYAKAA